MTIHVIAAKRLKYVYINVSLVLKIKKRCFPYIMNYIYIDLFDNCVAISAFNFQLTIHIVMVYKTLRNDPYLNIPLSILHRL